MPPLDPTAWERQWLDHDGAQWRARVDRLTMSCGACDVTRYLHVDAPNGERWTFTLAPDATLDGVSDQALQEMVKQRMVRARSES